MHEIEYKINHAILFLISERKAIKYSSNLFPLQKDVKGKSLYLSSFSFCSKGHEINEATIKNKEQKIVPYNPSHETIL